MVAKKIIILVFIFILSCSKKNSEYFVDNQSYNKWFNSYSNNYFALNNKTNFKARYFLKKDKGLLFLVESPSKGVLNYFPILSLVKTRDIYKLQKEYYKKLFPSPDIVNEKLELKVLEKSKKEIKIKIKKLHLGSHTVFDKTSSNNLNSTIEYILIINLDSSVISKSKGEINQNTIW